MAFDYIPGFALGMLGSLVGNLIFTSQAPGQFSLNQGQGQFKHQVAIENCLTQKEFKIPSFVTDVPAGHFAGISLPMDSLTEARRAAVADVVKQVLGAMGAQYDHRYVDTVAGRVRGGSARKVRDRLSGVAHGVVLGVERNIVESSWCRETSGRWVCFVLVQYPDRLIAEMRRLSRGAKIVASFISHNDGVARLKLTEVNGVGVTITRAEVTIRKKYRFAKIVSLFLCRVPEASEHHLSTAFGPVTLCGEAAKVRLPAGQYQRSIKDYFLGAKLERDAVLKGHDEIGRPVTASVVF